MPKRRKASHQCKGGKDPVSGLSAAQRFLKTNAVLYPRILPIVVNALVPPGFVERNGLGLTFAGFEHGAFGPVLLGDALQRKQHL